VCVCVCVCVCESETGFTVKTGKNDNRIPIMFNIIT